ncbi:MAG: class I tRNA ligase family protein, partial [Candidatus Aenigmarchaeota archaeon]|nr:class I tRNA ligase family protein [Candidatus Aenigmarchaeota archaeon]
ASILNAFSRWSLKIVRHRVSPSYEGSDRKSAQYTLLEVMENLLRALAPISPFITDHIYRDLFSGKSVHACDWPKPDNKLINKSLERNMETVKKISEAAGSLRQGKKIKLRWPIDKMFIRIEKPIRSLEGVIKGICNVEGVVWVKRISGRTKAFDGGKLALGKVLSDEKLIREFSRHVQVLRKKEKLHVRDKIKLFVKSGKAVEDTLRKREKDIMLGTGSVALTLGRMESERGKFTFEKEKVKIGFRKK